MVPLQNDYNARAVLAENVKRLMREHPEFTSPAKLSRRCFWPYGNKAGKRVSERRIRYVLSPRPADNFSPTLDLVEAIGAAFNVPAWRLLVDDTHLRGWAAERLFPVPGPATGAPRPAPSPLEATVPPRQAPPPSTAASRRKGARARR